ncbi:hypothetical protein RMATCC62417_06917 [Rhizopus microsporus]|nr:hypothetical protein RMATCC62417_06917 [Rhizopus microsporus]CEI92567.1 hypothetical protein RMCBS344292_06822 [Rhizopus microsporus]
MTTANKSDSMQYNKPSVINKTTVGDSQTMTRMHPSMKRPRAPIACYRCHHKKVRCDGIHPNCTRCLSTGILCAYPSSRRSRNTQPTNVDPFINNLSQLEAKIRRIETDLESQRNLVRSICGESNEVDKTSASTLTSRIIKTEKDLQESRSIVAQLRLRGEQRAARGRRAAAAAAAGSVSTSSGHDKNASSCSGRNNKMDHNAVSSTGRTKSSPVLSKKKSNQTTSNAAMSVMANNFNDSSSFYLASSSPSSSVDFMSPSSNYYFPSYTNDICVPYSNNSFQDWSLLNNLPRALDSNNNTTNGFVDPMIIAAAENSITPLLSVYVDDPSMMTARARALSHLPPSPEQSRENSILVPGLQPSLSSTSTSSSNSSFGLVNESNNALYDESYTQFMSNNEIMMMDQMTAAAAAAAIASNTNTNTATTTTTTTTATTATTTAK